MLGKSSLFAALLFLLNVPNVCPAQTSATGIAPFTAHGGGQDDSINLGSLNVTIPITLYQRKTRGDLLETHKLVYDLPQWTQGVDGGWMFEGGGWRESFMQPVMTTVDRASWDDERYDFVEDSIGADHYFGGGFGGVTQTDPTQVPTITSVASDDSGYVEWFYEPNPQIPQGNVWATDAHANDDQVDRNGNAIQYQLVRTLGNVPIDQQGYHGWGAWANATYTYPVQSGGSEHYVINASLHSFTNPFVSSSTAQFWLIDSIVLANGKSYSFTYDGSARLTQMITPTGTTYQYQWSGNQPSGYYGSGVGSKLTRTVNGTSVTTYTLSGQPYDTSGTVLKDTVVDPDGVTTTTWVTMDGEPYVSDNPIQTVYYECVESMDPNNPCGVATAGLPGVPTPTEPQFFTGSYTYSPGYSDVVGKTLVKQVTNKEDQTTSTVTTFYDVFGNILDTEYFDFGNINPQAPDREFRNLYDVATLPTELVEAQVFDHGNLIRDIKYGYDETSVVASGATDLFNPSPGISYHRRGNATSTSSWVSGNNWIPTTTSYYDTGNPYIAIDGRGNQAAQYSYNSTTGCDYAFPVSTTTQLGTTTGTWDCASGQIASSTDIRGVTTSYAYADPFSRLTKTTRSADGAITSIAYDETNRRVETRVRVQGSSASTPDSSWTDHIDQYDTFGRLSRSMDLHNGSSGPWVTKDYTFTPAGRPSNSPLPQFISGLTAGSTASTGAQISYDSYGRPIRSSYSAPSGGGAASTTTQYYGATQKVADEAGNSRLMQSNSFGQLVSVCELVNDGTGSACGMGISGSGYRTNYTYDALGDLKAVTQLGGTTTMSGSGTLVPDTPRSRVFSYDGLSRLVSAFNPEDGGICYGHGTYPNCNGDGYDKNGNLVFKTGQDNGGGGNMTIDYGYDTANRLTSKTPHGEYLNPITYNYTYGQSGSSKGLLASDSGIVSSAPTAGRTYSYDAVGNLTGGTFYDTDSQAYLTGFSNAVHDLLGEETQLTYPDGTTISKSYDNGGWLTAVSFAGTGGQSGAPIASFTYSASGRALNTLLGSSNVQSSSQENSRQQICNSSVQGVGHWGYIYDRNYYYGASAEEDCGFANDNNGNIHSIFDPTYYETGNEVDVTHSFGYDSLNRLTSAGSTNASSSTNYNFIYYPDAFGNLIPYDTAHPRQNYTVDPATNRLLLNGSTGDLQYNANGTPALLPGGAGGDLVPVIDGEGNIECFDRCDTTYVYNADGTRAWAGRGPLDNSTGYIYFDGAPMAERTTAYAAGTITFTDRVYANGQQIAWIAPQKPLLHLHMTRNTASCSLTLAAAVPTGTPIAVDDNLAMSMEGAGSVQLGVQIAQSAPPTGSPSDLSDDNGNDMSSMSLSDHTWLHETADLTPYESCASGTDQGCTNQLQQVRFSIQPGTPSGAVDLWLKDVVIQHADGSVTPIVTANQISLAPVGESGSPLSTNGQNFCAGTNVTLDYNQVSLPLDEATTYIAGDQVGTTSVEIAPGGWAVWKQGFTPFGQEVVNNSTQDVLGTVPADGTTNKDKFTGKERDTESGLDYFGARFYGANMGRFASPDPSGLGYADLRNPQSLNLYSYVQNNPMKFIDPSGLDHCEDQGGQLLDDDEGGDNDTDCAEVGGIWKVETPPTNITGVSADPDPLDITDASTNSSTDCNSIGVGSGGVGLNMLGNTIGQLADHPVQLVTGAAMAAELTAQWATGLGASSHIFGPTSTQSQQMANSPGVVDAVNNFMDHGIVSGGYDFDHVGPVISAGANATQQFVGGYSYNVVPSPGMLTVFVYNQTSMRSASYHLGPSWSRSTFGPGGTTDQLFQINVPCDIP